MPNYVLLTSLLEERLRVISDTELRETQPEKQLQQLQEVSVAIQQWHSTHQADIPNRLNHFLQQSSLSKALDYLREQQLT